MPGTLPEILQNKSAGDEWITYMAPEELHVWYKPWDRIKFKNYDVAILSVGVTASETVKNTKNEHRFSVKNPLYLASTGVEVTQGRQGTKSKRYGSFKFRVDSIIELNRCMKEIVSLTDIQQWQLKSIEISNHKTGGICEFRRHNPDGNGTSLYLWRIETDNMSRLYPDITITDQAHYLGKFKQYFAACKCTEAMQKFHGCVLERKKKAI